MSTKVSKTVSKKPTVKPEDDITPMFTKTKSVKSSVKLVSFSVTAVIPTQSYGNIQPSIQVTAGTIEEARNVVMPVIEDLYKTYAETPLNGKDPRFVGKITETVKTVPVIKEVDVVAPAPVAAPTFEVEVPVEKPESVLKAEKMISMATTTPAIELIQDKINASVKIPSEFKADLITLVLKKRNELKGK
jgi:hypothetical protein